MQQRNSTDEGNFKKFDNKIFGICARDRHDILE